MALTCYRDGGGHPSGAGGGGGRDGRDCGRQSLPQGEHPRGVV